LRIARVAARNAVVFLFALLAISPATALAFNPPDPNSPGHHYGEYLHNKHLRSSQPTPAPGGGNSNKGGGGGIQNSFGVLKSGAAGPSALTLPAFHFQPNGLALPALIAGSNAGKDAWWVVVLLASFIAANVVLVVLYGTRGGNYVVRRVLRPMLATA
jgi:hypothetical protein